MIAVSIHAAHLESYDNLLEYIYDEQPFPGTARTEEAATERKLRRQQWKMSSRKEMKDEEEEAWEMKAVACDCNRQLYKARRDY